MLRGIKARMHRQAGGPCPRCSLGREGAARERGAGQLLWGSSWVLGAGGRDRPCPFPPRALARRAGALPPTAISTLQTVPAAFLVLLRNQDPKNMLLCALQAFLSWASCSDSPLRDHLGWWLPDEEGKFPLLSPQSQAFAACRDVFLHNRHK